MISGESSAHRLSERCLERIEKLDKRGPAVNAVIELNPEALALTSRQYRKALARSRRLSRQEGIDAPLRKHRIDAIVVPSGGPAWLIDAVNSEFAAHAVGGEDG